MLLSACEVVHACNYLIPRVVGAVIRTILLRRNLQAAELRKPPVAFAALVHVPVHSLNVAARRARAPSSAAAMPFAPTPPLTDMAKECSLATVNYIATFTPHSPGEV